MNVLIVESAAKARTLARYLGPDWKVLATGGHVQTLPYDRSVHGKDASKAFWANRPGELPRPPWAWTERGEEALEKIVAESVSDATYWIATDPDREGEFIAWRLERLLEGRGTIHRVSFQEVTEEAVSAAIAVPGEVDRKLVESAQVRMFLDRLVGFRGAKMAKSVLGGGTASMGRVQTPTLGFVVDRELEREAHVPIPYFEVQARAGGIPLEVRFHEPGDEALWRDNAGKAHPTRTFDEELATAAEGAIREAGEVVVTEATEGSGSSRPRAPFSTDALLQAAGSRFGWSPGKTSTLASMLYQSGHITYIRTDSTRLAASAIAAARRVVEETYGADHLGKSGPPAAGPKGGPVQDAHEAIRPTRLEVDEAPVEDADARRLYRLVRAHTLAAQMAPSRYRTYQIRARAEGLDLPLAGTVRWRIFAGWEAVYGEFRSEPATAPPEAPLEVQARWRLDPEEADAPNPRLIQDETKPPSRYRRHSLIRAMKEAGIGRPSTYSSTVEKLEDRRYLVEEDGALVPTERGRAVWLDVAPLYVREESDTELFSAEFTALMEEGLDAVARGEDVPAEIWERWRDEVRALHDIARERRQEGGLTPRTREVLERLLANAPDAARGDLDTLSEQEGREMLARLRETGIRPAPTPRQRDYLESLVEDLGMDPVEAAARIGLGALDEIRTSDQASALIEELKAIHDERRPPTAKQTKLIEKLVEELGMDGAEAAALVGEESLEALTGGRDGSASALIDLLLERSAKAKKERKGERVS